MPDREALVLGYQSGRPLETIRSMFSADRSERTKLALDLAALHNEGAIDLLTIFGALTREAYGGSDFFPLRQVFEEALPEIEAPVPELTRVVLHLYREAVDDLAAGTILDALRGFYAKSPDRPRAALAEIEANAEALADLLDTTLIAGSAEDSSFFVGETIRLCGEANVGVRKRAFYALGRLQGDPNHATSEAAVCTLEHAVATEADDGVLASVLSSTFELTRQPSADQSRLISIIAGALVNGSEVTLHAAARIFGVRTREISPELLQLLLDHLANVEPANRRTLEAIDYGISQLLESNSVEEGLCLLEKLLRSNSQNLDLPVFDNTVRIIRGTPALRSKVATRWLLGGDPNLCDGLDKIVEPRASDPLELDADEVELADVESLRFLFAARKAIGYLFLHPVSVASFIVSLIRQAPEASLRGRLGGLLFNPLLLNFSAAVSEYLDEQEDSEPPEVQTAIKVAREALENYLAGLPSAGDLPALHPRLEHRHAYHRHFSEDVARSFEQAQAESVLLQLVHRSVLLYGRKAIHHVLGPDGDVSRMETQLGSHGTSIEVPRMTILDPLGLDLMLRMFRYEQINA